MEKLRSQERQAPPTDRVTTFVTQAWHHPLLTQATIEHRARGKENVQELLAKHTISSEAYVAIPVGSTYFNVDRHSDHDFVILSSYPILLYSDLPSKVHIVHNASFDYYDYAKNPYFHLLFTPDEYLAGNIAKARQIRLNTMEALAHDNATLWNDADSAISLFFQRNYSYLPESDVLCDAGKVDEQGIDRSKLMRFYIQRAAFSSRYPNPQKWIEAFEKSRQTFLPPSFDTYQKGLEASLGAIHLAHNNN